MKKLLLLALIGIALPCYAQNVPEGSGRRASDGIQIGGHDANDFNYVLVDDNGAMSTSSVLAAGENVVGKVVGVSAIVSGNFTRPADTTAYASGDLVANNTTAGSVTPITLAVARANDATGMIRRVRLKKSGTGVTNASFRVHFYRTSPTVTNGDNGAWLSTESTYLGAADVTVDKAFSDASAGLGAPNTGSEINFAPASGTQNIFALIEARGAYTPASAEVFTLTVEVLQN